MAADHGKLSYLRNSHPVDVPYTTIPAMVQRHAKDPQSVAQTYINWETYEKEQLTYSDIYKSAIKLASGLMNLGIKKGDVVALGTDNTPEWMTALVGIQICGAIPLMFVFNRKDGSDVVALMERVKDRCKAIIFTAGLDDMNISIVNNVVRKELRKGHISVPYLQALKWSILISDSDCEYNHLCMDDIYNIGHSDSKLPSIDPEDVAAIFPTSGSTGVPKLIPYTHFSLLVAGFQFAMAYGKLSMTFFNDRLFGWIVG